MAITDTRIELASQRVEASRRVQPGCRIVQRWQASRAERRRARLMSIRNRRSLVRLLRLVAKDSLDSNRFRRRNDVLLRYRAATVRGDLLQVAAMLDNASDPDPACIAVLHDLLRDGISPLYNPAVDASELQDTLDYVRQGLNPNA